ncbi:MAG: hypothetical protein FJ315_01950 [SAR202 cluster bacterium]|nr:hypothetical protein [SAR202 cluster bacterium]
MSAMFFEAPFKSESSAREPLYTSKAYRSSPGHGALKGYDRQGKLVCSSRGPLVFCEVFTTRELADAGLLVSVVQNVADGARLDGRPCPDI